MSPELPGNAATARHRVRLAVGQADVDITDRDIKALAGRRYGRQPESPEWLSFRK